MSSDDASATTSQCYDSDVEDDPTLLKNAIDKKDEGNQKLKEGQLLQAKESYKAGIKCLGKRSLKFEQAHESAFKALHLNLGLVCIKLEDFREAVTALDAVIATDSKNAKAFLRRAICYSRLASLDEAKEDLIACLKLEPTNREARTELQLVKEKAQQAKANQKAAFSGLFKKELSLYADRKDEVPPPRPQQDQEDPSISSPAPKKAEVENPPPPLRPPQLNQTPDHDEDNAEKKKPKIDDSSDYDEEDLKILAETKKKGYCYFKRELTAEEKWMKENKFVPRKLDSVETPEEKASPNSQMKRGVSEWNAAGITYEEKDTSDWCKEKLRELCTDIELVLNRDSELSHLKTAVELGLVDDLRSLLSSFKDKANLFDMVVVKTTEVTTTGEAQLMVLRGTRRWFYELTLIVLCEVHLWRDQESTKTISLTLNVNDIASTPEGPTEAIRNSRISCKESSSLSPLELQILNVASACLKVECLGKIREFDTLYKRDQ